MLILIAGLIQAWLMHLSVSFHCRQVTRQNRNVRICWESAQRRQRSEQPSCATRVAKTLPPRSCVSFTAVPMQKGSPTIRSSRQWRSTKTLVQSVLKVSSASGTQEHKLRVCPALTGKRCATKGRNLLEITEIRCISPGKKTYGLLRNTGLIIEFQTQQGYNRS